MPTRLDTKLVPRVLTLIDRYGLNATFEIATANDYDPTDGSVNKTETSFVRKVTPPYPSKTQHAGGTIVQPGTETAYVAAKDIPTAPTVDTVLTFGQAKWTVTEVGEIRTGELIALYEMKLEK